MTTEENQMLLHLGKVEAYFELSTKLEKMVKVSSKRRFWYLRPSHTTLMDIWDIINDDWATLLKADPRVNSK